jgi:hypothetical protein
MENQRKMELNGEAADQITILNLKEHLDILEENAKEILENKDKLEDYQKANLEFNLRMQLHLREVLKYFGD